jgi:hypothetical protein
LWKQAGKKHCDGGVESKALKHDPCPDMSAAAVSLAANGKVCADWDTAQSPWQPCLTPGGSGRFQAFFNQLPIFCLWQAYVLLPGPIGALLNYPEPQPKEKSLLGLP